MYIKDKNRNKDNICFVCMPVFDTHRLINRARAIVDDYFTFVNYENYTERYNFRKYCIEPMFDTHNEQRRLIGARVECLLFYDKEFALEFYKNGEIKAYYPEPSKIFNHDLFEQVIERTVKYVSIS